jgi:hypothetical protein
MVEYHDTEWGVPVHDDTELFERLALESFQAGLSWSTILNKRDAFRAGFRGFDPAVVARFDDEDRARLMADAGIVRNRAKIDATIGNAIGSLELAREFGSLDAYLTSIVPGPPLRLAGRFDRRRHPSKHAGLGCAVEGPQAPRVPLRRVDDRLCLHAERRSRRRPSAGLFPVWRRWRDTLAVNPELETPPIEPSDGAKESTR